MPYKRPPPFVSPTVDIAETLCFIMGDTGDLHETLGGFRIRVHHTRAFPWADVFKILLFRDFKVYVRRHKADISIEATP